jgi:hypothetical protein
LPSDRPSIAMSKSIVHFAVDDTLVRTVGPKRFAAAGIH